jgi:DNA invertase Pin-like site-specific DNA recombinase
MLSEINKDADTCRLYTRVSTQKQGFSGLGLDAQKQIATAKAKELGLKIIEECTEVESGRKTRLGRPVLREALEKCKADGAVLIVAKMDRLTRNFSFLSKLAESAERDGIGIVAADIPSMGSPWQTKMMWRILASVAEAEAEAAAERTKVALGIAKERGVTLGNPDVRDVRKLGTQATKKNTKAFAKKIYPTIVEIKEAGIISLRGIAKALNARGVKTYQAEMIDENTSRRKEGKPAPIWRAESVKKLINSIEGGKK